MENNTVDMKDFIANELCYVTLEKDNFEVFVKYLDEHINDKLIDDVNSMWSKAYDTSGNVTATDDEIEAYKQELNDYYWNLLYDISNKYEVIYEGEVL